MFFLLIAYPVLEFYLLFKVGAEIGFVNTFFYLLVSAVFGIGLIRSQSAYLMKNAPKPGAAQLPAGKLVHSMLLFMSGAFFIFPGFISDVIGLLLLLPGTRHLAALAMKKKFAQMMKNGSVRFAQSGFGGFAGGFSSGFTNWPQGPAGPLRDVSPREIDSASSEIIDVTPIKKGPAKEDT